MFPATFEASSTVRASTLRMRPFSCWTAMKIRRRGHVVLQPRMACCGRCPFRRRSGHLRRQFDGHGPGQAAHDAFAIRQSLDDDVHEVGSLALRPVVSMCFSSSSRKRPRGEKISLASATWASLAPLPLATTVMPLPMEQGVLGMARSTGQAPPLASSKNAVLTPAAMEMSRGLWARAPFAWRSSNTFGMSLGFTQRIKISAQAATPALSVEQATPWSFVKVSAVAARRVVARSCVGFTLLDFKGPKRWSCPWCRSR